MANQKMLDISFMILRNLMILCPREHIDFVFAGILNPGDVVEMVIFELIKRTYDKTEKKHSMRYFYDKNGITEQDQIMRYSRIQSYVQKYRKREYNWRCNELDVDVMKVMNELIPPDMSDMRTKIDGYQMTEMNFFELTTILENDFTKSFTEYRIIDSKKVSNKRFKEIMAQYDDKIFKMNNCWTKSVEEAVFNTIAAFTLEWKYNVNYIYEIARRMEEKRIAEFPNQQSRMATFCADIHYTSEILKYKISAHSRMVTVRERYIDLMLSEPKGSLLFEAEQVAYLEGLVMVSILVNHMTVDDMPIQEWFLHNTTKKDWASFFMDYDIFSCINGYERHWSNKTIRYFRECLNMLLRRGEIS